MRFAVFIECLFNSARRMVFRGRSDREDRLRMSPLCVTLEPGHLGVRGTRRIFIDQSSGILIRIELLRELVRRNRLRKNIADRVSFLVRHLAILMDIDYPRATGRRSLKNDRPVFLLLGVEGGLLSFDG